MVPGLDQPTKGRYELGLGPNQRCKDGLCKVQCSLACDFLINLALKFLLGGSSSGGLHDPALQLLRGVRELYTMHYTLAMAGQDWGAHGSAPCHPSEE